MCLALFKAKLIETKLEFVDHRAEFHNFGSLNQIPGKLYSITVWGISDNLAFIAPSIESQTIDNNAFS